MSKFNLYNLLFESEDSIGSNAQPEVKKAIERWHSLPKEERNVPLLYWLLGGGTPEFKMSKEDSQYTDESKNEKQTCANCEYAYLSNSNGNYICSKISGDIKLEGWCNLWDEGDNTIFDK